MIQTLNRGNCESATTKKETERESMVKIKISYEDAEQAKSVLKILATLFIAGKVKRSENGKYKKIYISLK